MRALGCVLLVACGGGSSTPSTTAGTGSAAPPPIVVAPPSKEPACLPHGKWYGLHSFTVDDQQVTVCTADRICEPKRPSCVGYALADGKRSPATAPVVPITRGHSVVDKAGALELCSPAGKCVPLPFKATGTAMVDHQIHAAVGADDKVAAIAGEVLDAMYLVDARTGRQLAKVTGEKRDGNCLVEPYFLGDVIYARSCASSFPMHTDYLFRADGTRIGILNGVAIPLGDRPVQIAGTQWAVHLEEGDGYLVFDTRTGERVRSVPEKLPHLHAEGDEHERRGPIKSPAGKLVVIGDEIVVSDPATGKIEQTWALPYCAPDPDKPTCP
jgi:hypothetical protein